jgi:hypothetical protein
VSHQPVIAIRPAQPDEQHVLRRLAALDSAATPHDPVLLALADGEPVAALSVSTGAVVADPWVATADAVALLRARAAQLTVAPPRPRRSVLRAFAGLRAGFAGD